MIKEGNIIEGPFWNEPVKVEKLKHVGDRIHIVGYKINSKELINQLLNEDDISLLEIQKSEIDFSANPRETFYLIEAKG